MQSLASTINMLQSKVSDKPDDTKDKGMNEFYHEMTGKRMVVNRDNNGSSSEVSNKDRNGMANGQAI